MAKAALARLANGEQASWAEQFARTQQSFADALAALRPYKKEVGALWQRELQRITGPDGEKALRVNAWRLVERVPMMDFETFRDGLESLGQDLAGRGIPPEQLGSLMNGFLETCLAPLIRTKPESASAVLRINSIARHFLNSSYYRHHRLHIAALQDQLAHANEQLQLASAYVTNVYEQERRRLSHDLHDDVGHDLVMLKLHLEMTLADLERKKIDALRPRLHEARTLVSHTIDSIRRIVLDLGPAVFDDLGFVPAVRFYARRFSASTGIEISVHDTPIPEDLPSSHQTALYRLLQGALSNVMKHSAATKVRIGLACFRNAMIVMTIEDDGVGFDVATKAIDKRFGLTAMVERIGVLGGKVHVQSWKAGSPRGRHGTRIEVDLPIPGAGAVA